MITTRKEVREKKEDSKMHGRIWVSLSEIAKSRGGAECAVWLEIMVRILNKFDFKWYFGYLSRTGTAYEPGLLRYSEADVYPINKNIRTFQKNIPEPSPVLYLVRPYPGCHTTFSVETTIPFTSALSVLRAGF